VQSALHFLYILKREIVLAEIRFTSDEFLANQSSLTAGMAHLPRITPQKARPKNSRSSASLFWLPSYHENNFKL